MSYFIMGVLAGLVLVVAGVFTTGYEVGRDRRRKLLDLQAALERTARAQAWAHEQRLPASGRFASQPSEEPCPVCGAVGNEKHLAWCPPRGRSAPFPVDTEPLLLLSDSMAAGVALEREIRELGHRAWEEYGPTP